MKKIFKTQIIVLAFTLFISFCGVNVRTKEYSLCSSLFSDATVLLAFDWDWKNS